MHVFVNTIVRQALCIAVFFALTTCKKYPDNILWFKRYKKISPFDSQSKNKIGTHLIKYTVNGIDSLDLLSTYFSTNVKWPNLVKDIRQATFYTARHSRYTWYSDIFFSDGSSNVTNPYNISLGYDYKKEGKSIVLFHERDTGLFDKNIFIGPEIVWQILQIGKNPFRATTTLENGNRYEIEIGN